MQDLLGYNSKGKCKVLIIIIFQSKQTSAQLEIKDKYTAMIWNAWKQPRKSQKRNFWSMNGGT